MRDANAVDCPSWIRIEGIDDRVYCQRRKFGHKKDCKAIWLGGTGLVTYKVKFRWRML